MGAVSRLVNIHSSIWSIYSHSAPQPGRERSMNIKANLQFSDVQQAAQRIRGAAHRTPVMTSRMANEITGAELFFKCENLQRIGAFKFRGAYNALSQFSEQQRRNGVLTFSSGNHAQAIALSAKLLGIRAVIIMPEDAPEAKIRAT